MSRTRVLSQKETGDLWRMSVDYSRSTCATGRVEVITIPAAVTPLTCCRLTFLGLNLHSAGMLLWSESVILSVLVLLSAVSLLGLRQWLLVVTSTEQTDGRCWMKWNYSDRFYLSRTPRTEMIMVCWLQKWWILNVCWLRGCGCRWLSFIHGVNRILYLF